MKTAIYAAVIIALTALSSYAIKAYNDAINNAKDHGFAQCDTAHKAADNLALAEVIKERDALNLKYIEADRRANERQGVLNERVTKIRAVDWSNVVIPDAVDSVLAEDDHEIRLYQARSENL